MTSHLMLEFTLEKYQIIKLYKISSSEIQLGVFCNIWRASSL